MTPQTLIHCKSNDNIKQITDNDTWKSESKHLLSYLLPQLLPYLKLRWIKAYRQSVRAWEQKSRWITIGCVSCLSLQLILLSFVLAIRLCLIRNEATYSATEYKAEIFDSRYRYIHQTFIVFYIKSNHLRPIHSGNN